MKTPHTTRRRGFRGERRHLSRQLAAFLATVALIFAGPLSAMAASPSPSPSSSRWSLVPADATGPDGRRSVEEALDPGQSQDEHLALHNLGGEEMKFRLAAADGFFTNTGRFDTLTEDQASTGLGSWIELDPEVTVAPGETAIVPFRVSVPQTAEPGDYAAGITASITSVQSAPDGTSVGVQSRIGFRVSVLVKGELHPMLSIATVSSSYSQNWNPLRPGSATIEFTVSNDGNTRLAAKGTVSVGDETVTFPQEGEAPQELLPGDKRSISVQVDDVWPLLAVPVRIVVAPEVVSRAENPPQVDDVSSQSTLWSAPLPQLVMLMGLVLIAMALVWRRKSTQRHLRDLLEDAREEGRREAATGERAS